MVPGGMGTPAARRNWLARRRSMLPVPKGCAQHAPHDLTRPSSFPLRAMPCHAMPQVYAAATAMLGSSKLPVRMAGVSLSAALYTAEGDAAKADLGVEDMEPRIRSQVRGRRE